MWSRWRPQRQDLLDVLMGISALSLGWLELFAAGGVPDTLATRAPLVMLVAVQTLPIVLRRWAPIPVLLIVLAADLALLFPQLATPSGDLGGSSMVALQVAIYTVNAHHARALALAVTAAVPLALIGAMLLFGQPPTEFGWLLISFITPTVAIALFGGYIRERRIHAAALERRALALEAERDEVERTAAAAERARIARELHDVVAHSMSVMVVQAGAARRIIGDDPERAREALRSIEVTGRDALAELRRLLGVLRRDERAEAALAPQPGLGQLDALVRRFNDAGLAVQLVVESNGRTLAPGADLSAYRIVQEALTNTLKHARAMRASVIVRSDADGVEVEVTDDGQGALATDGGGSGLIGMRERVSFFGGDFRAGSRPGGGFRVWARFPLSA